MTDRTRKTLVFLTLPVVVVWAFYSLTEKRAVKPSAPQPPPTQAVIGQPTANQPGPVIDIAEKQLALWGNDPFQARQTSAGVKQQELTWHLSGIMYSNQTPVAIINNRPVHTGDMIDNARVIAIEGKTVTLEHEGRLLTLTVKG
ncbi:MAG TPA: hypothetical protein VN285_09180 [Candidatus Deferrimicrobium sp.]|nr:hypothetical protein [Candidatus Deferrimicrobium sp.]